MVTLKAVCETRTAKSRRTAIASRMMTCLRLGRFTARVGVDGTTLSRTAAIIDGWVAGRTHLAVRDGLCKYWVILSGAWAQRPILSQDDKGIGQCFVSRPAVSSASHAAYAGLGW